MVKKSEFRKRILEIKPFFKEEDIDSFFSRLMIIQEYNKSWKLQTITTMDSDSTEYFQNQVVKNTIESVKITEDEYNKSGISKKEFLNRLRK